METPLYRIEEETTTGFAPVVINLTKEECRKKYEELLDGGVSPNRIKIVRES